MDMPLKVGPCVYLIHFERKLAHAQHYMGSTLDIFGRLGAHREGRNGARLMQVIAEAGIDWELARVWWCETEAEARQLERHLKKQKRGPRLCPICRQERDQRRSECPSSPVASRTERAGEANAQAEPGRKVGAVDD